MKNIKLNRLNFDTSINKVTENEDHKFIYSNGSIKLNVITSQRFEITLSFLWYDVIENE